MIFFAIYTEETGQWINSFGSKSSMGWTDAPKLFATEKEAKHTLTGLASRASYERKRGYPERWINDVSNAKIVQVTLSIQ